MTDSREEPRSVSHTPGPWTTGGYYIKADDGKRLIADLAMSMGCVSLDDEGLANARLIAAAPEMLEMLHRVLSSERRKVKENRAMWFDQLCDVVTKAEDRS